jgi:hypothetical protein
MSQKGFNDPQRIITCGNCDIGQTVEAAFKNEFSCIRCGEHICIYCGCTEMTPCHHPDFPIGELTCHWVKDGQCSFCFCMAAEEAYWIATGRPDRVVPRPEPIRQRVLPATRFEVR